MAQTNRTPAQTRIARFAAIRRTRTATIGRTSTTRQVATRVAANDDMDADVLAACVAASGFDQNAHLGY